MADMSVKEAIEVLVQHAAQNRDPGILAAIKHVESGLAGQQEGRPTDKHDSPGMKAARGHMRPEYHKGGPQRGRETEAATATAKGSQEGNSE